ncbi:MAG TPA: hypothetical protein PKJ97_00390 [Candidatus Bilamarchaeaceae archaeon]|nr:hypothetical protein [Candidatus Bilamarchaeaceae archaeon]
MAGREVARKIASLQPAERNCGQFRLMETPEREFHRLFEAYQKSGLGLIDIFSRIFGPGKGRAAEKAAGFVSSFPEPHLRSSMAITLITVHEYTKEPDYASRLMDFCTEADGGGKLGAQAACIGAHVARIAANVGETHHHNPSETLDILFSFSGSAFLRDEIVNVIMCLSRISSGTFEPKIFNNALKATRMLAEVSPSNVRPFLTSLARLSDMGEHEAVNGASGSMIAIWTFRKDCVAYFPGLMDALANRNVAEISAIADEMRSLFCKFEPVQ